ncbi:MAG: PqqD family protein [Acidimicrobiia bacterium]
MQLRSEALDWLVVDAEIVALDGRQDLYLGLNQSGAELWRALANGTTRTQLVELLVETFDIDRETASRDTDAFLAALTDRDLLLEI